MKVIVTEHTKDAGLIYWKVLYTGRLIAETKSHILTQRRFIKRWLPKKGYYKGKLIKLFKVEEV